MNIISIINNKGGVGKTTITQNLGVCMARKGYQTAVIDFDAQANLSYSIKHDLNKDLGSLLLKKTPITIEDFSTTEYKNLYILPNEKDINGALFGRMNPADQLFALKNILKDLNTFDFIFIDTAPNLDTPTFNALIACNHVLIPVEYDIFSAIGIAVLYDNINSAKQVNPNLKILGVITTKVHKGRKINKEMQVPLIKHFRDVVFKTVIRTNEKFKQAQAEQTDIFNFESSFSEKRGSEDMEDFSKELVERLKKCN
jgi:chromosome partitioning protein